jgi:hypothetical protein
MTFFEICLDEISYDTPYLQVCTEKKVFENIFFLEKSPVQPLQPREERRQRVKSSDGKAVLAMQEIITLVKTAKEKFIDDNRALQQPTSPC